MPLAEGSGEGGLTTERVASLENRRFVHMSAINAQSAYGVKAECVNNYGQTRLVGKQATTHPSPFWQRIVKAWGRQGLPTSQNGVAKKLDMSQGSTRRWYTGDGYPEIPQLIEIARLGKCSIHWLLTDEPPESPISDPDTIALLRHWSDISPEARKAILRAAWLEHTLTGNHGLSDTGRHRSPNKNR